MNREDLHYVCKCEKLASGDFKVRKGQAVLLHYLWLVCEVVCACGSCGWMIEV